MYSEVAYTASATATYDRPRFSAEATAYANRMQGYIYLKPDLAPVLTVRGAFPSFSYTQTNALLVGIDAQARWLITPAWQLMHKSSWLRGQDLAASAPLIYMPANRLEHSIRYVLGGKYSKYTPYVQASSTTVLRQNLVPASGDYAPPPHAYTLLGLELGATLPTHAGKELSVIVSATNVLNTVYRDYLNRYRYFAPEMGRNIALRLSYGF
jgi:iron complex outermembrane receptor protein